jgi:hypothetical protein
MYGDETAEAAGMVYGYEGRVYRASGVGPGAEHLKKGDADRDLAVPVVETVDVGALLKWASPDAAEVLRVVVSWPEFQRRVILEGEWEKGFVSEASKRLRVSGFRLKQMRELFYIRRMRHRPTWGSTCSLFFIPKDSSKERLIYNGRPLNARCQRPTNVGFVPMHDMLRCLTRSSVSAFASYDFVSWFVQLRVVREVQEVFAVEAYDGSTWRLTGLPMGWSWAPVVAQRVASTIVEEARRRLADPRVEAFVYIEIFIFAINGEDVGKERLRAVDRVFREVCGEVGAVLKETATVLGTEVDWLGVLLVAGSRQVRMREAFVEKAAGVRGDREWWREAGTVLVAGCGDRGPSNVVGGSSPGGNVFRTAMDGADGVGVGEWAKVMGQPGGGVGGCKEGFADSIDLDCRRCRPVCGVGACVARIGGHWGVGCSGWRVRCERIRVSSRGFCDSWPEVQERGRGTAAYQCRGIRGNA